MDGNVQLYDKLLQLPLFQGMSHDDLTLVVGHTKIGFHKLSAGHLLVKDGDICDQLYCLMSGALTVETIAVRGNAFSTRFDSTRALVWTQPTVYTYLYD